ncbi:MAG: uracil-DNA glycosylase [Pseudomonadota bacterium]
MAPGWRAALAPEWAQDYMAELSAFVEAEYAGATVYPPQDQIFSAFEHCDLAGVKAVILGQDPYHGPGQAHGLCFSVSGAPPPPSLRNIFKEIETDLGRRGAQDPCLERWARQGVLLLNATLTVRQGAAASHQKRGWERFTDAAIATLAARRRGVAYLLWGAAAQKKAAMVDAAENLILKAAHPSPLSAHRGFLGCGHFSSANAYFSAKGVAPIDW